MLKALRTFWVSLLLFLLVGCLNYADYSLQAYTNATELKAKSLSLLANSGTSFASHRTRAEALLLDIAVAHEFSAGVEHNNEAAKMWALISAPDEGLVGGFVKAWREDQPDGFGKRFRQAYRDDIEFAFDRLICLEVNKREPTACPKI